MSKANLVKDVDNVLFGKDGIIIRKHIAGLEGGRVLNTDGYTSEVIPCGMPVCSKTTSGVKDYKPVPPADTTDGSTTTYGFKLPSGYAYEGIAAATVKAGSSCPVMISGVVNETAMLESLKELFPSKMETPTALSLLGLKAACPHLIFMTDEVA